VTKAIRRKEPRLWRSGLKWEIWEICGGRIPHGQTISNTVKRCSAKATVSLTPKLLRSNP
jgi:hypothetical protein